MPYAIDGQISQESLPGGIEITDEQYQAALDGVLSGQHVQVVDGALIVGALPELAPEDPAPPTPGQVAETYRNEVQTHMDTSAQVAGYDDIKTAVTYADEPAVPRFQAEGKAFRAWRSKCWAYCYEQLALIQGGKRAQPTIPELLAELPQLELPHD